MPEKENSPLSYQTTMPDPIDTSYQAYSSEMGLSGPRFIQSIASWASGKPSYEQWQSAKQNDYNQRMSAYNTWLQSGAGIRASAESGAYNPSYFSNGAASASPVDYQVAPDANGFNELSQGIQGVFHFAQSIAGLQMMGAQIQGQNLKNKAQEIQNQWLDLMLMNKTYGLGYSADYRKMVNEALLGSRFGDPFGGVRIYGTGTYDVGDWNKGFIYDRNFQDVARIKASIRLMDDQAALARASEKEKTWVRENLFEIQKQILQHSAGLLKGELDFQPIEQKLRKSGIIAGIGVNVINATANLVKTFLGGGVGNAVGGALSGLTSGKTAKPSFGGTGVDPFDLSGYGTLSFE